MNAHHGIICSLPTSTKHLVQYEVEQQGRESLMVMYEDGPPHPPPPPHQHQGKVCFITLYKFRYNMFSCKN